MIRHSLQLAALFQAAVAVVFGASLWIWRPLPEATALLSTDAARTLMLLGASALLLFLSSLGRFASSEQGAGLVLALLSALLPWADLELCLRDFVEREDSKTHLFLRDANLGWRLRPGVEAEWGGYPVRINDKGLRGPAVPYTRERNSIRVLYLGDSVTFGYKLRRSEDAYPFQTGRLLEDHFGVEVETINAGVGGYSPWQELGFLQREGLRYAPDLVVVGFVLNDVTEKMGLRRFGGTGEGSQLSVSYDSRLDALLARSAIYRGARSLYARARFGPDVAAGALAQEALDIRHLLQAEPDPRVDEAWQITLDSLEAIFALCREADIPALLVAFPDLLQLPGRPARDEPQRILTAFAREHDIALLDLLPPMARAARHQPREWQRFFLDHDHLTTAGSQVAAQRIHAFIARNCRDLLPDHCPGVGSTARPAPDT